MTMRVRVLAVIVRFCILGKAYPKRAAKPKVLRGLSAEGGVVEGGRAELDLVVLAGAGFQ